MSSVTGGIDLALDDRVDADLVVDSIIGEVDSKVDGVRISRTDASSFRASIGSGGRPIEISSVVGSVTLRRKR